jgi:hypothetical protein
MRGLFSIVLAFLVKKKTKIKFLIASLKTVTNSQDCSESLFFPLSFSLIGQFQDHRRLSGQLLE